MDEKTQQLLISLIETVRENSFDICFCLEILKQDPNVAKLYEISKAKFDEQLAEKNNNINEEKGE